MATDLRRWDPFRDLLPLRAEIERLLTSPSFGESTIPRRWTPTADIVESDDEIVITAELPGVKDEDIEITVEDGALRISGERTFEHEARDDHTYRLERSHGAFERLIPLPPGIREDDITAGIAYGVLKVTVPKAAASQPRRVPLSEGV
jgi:HSP20 family protein